MTMTAAPRMFWIDITRMLKDSTDFLSLRATSREGLNAAEYRLREVQPMQGKRSFVQLHRCMVCDKRCEKPRSFYWHPFSALVCHDTSCILAGVAGFLRHCLEVSRVPFVTAAPARVKVPRTRGGYSAGKAEGACAWREDCTAKTLLLHVRFQQTISDTGEQIPGEEYSCWKYIPPPDGTEWTGRLLFRDAFPTWLQTAIDRLPRRRPGGSADGGVP